MNNKCPCYIAMPIAKFPERDNLIEEFAKVRNQCPAIKEIIVPDTIWDNFRRKAGEPLDAARHNYSILLAFESGYLPIFTHPVHNYLLKNGKPKSNLNPNYRRDLQESWMLGKSEEKRNELYKGYSGKLSELRCAVWLQNQGWKINNLEALGGDNDIEATSPGGIKYCIEVKFIGFETEKFLATIKGKGGNFDPSTDADYILYIAYTAAKQLKLSENDNKIVIIEIDRQEWERKEIALCDGWINFDAPNFYDKNASYIRRDKYPNIDNELSDTLSFLKKLWVICQDSDYEYIKKFSYDFKV